MCVSSPRIYETHLLSAICYLSFGREPQRVVAGTHIAHLTRKRAVIKEGHRLGWKGRLVRTFWGEIPATFRREPTEPFLFPFSCPLGALAGFGLVEKFTLRRA